MRTKLKIAAILGAALLFALFVYGLGYYRGYHDRSRILTSLHLGFAEAQYDNLQQKKDGDAARQFRSHHWLRKGKS